jgi:hypothetical protein
MNKLTVLLGVILLMLVSQAVSQVPPPPAAPGAPTKKFSGWPSIDSVSSSDEFVSLDGRFKIRLPKQIAGFAALSPKQTGGNITGQQFTWKFSETELTVVFLDFPDSTLTGSPADLSQIAANSNKDVAQRLPDAKLLSEKQYLLNEVPASNAVYDLGSDGYITIQLYLDKKRLYRSVARFNDDATRDKLTSIFNSFELVSQDSVNAELQSRYDAAKPGPLPQSPVVAKATSDAEDKGLKGKVQKVIEESEDRSGTWGVQGRKISSIEYFDQNGAITHRDSYDSNGNPFQIIVYGYVAGKRVSNSGIIRSESDPPPVAMRGKVVDEEKSDPRYEYSYEFKYKEGKLIEKQMVHGSGKKGLRYVYKHSRNKREERVYTEDGELNQRYLMVLDDKGNVLERTDFGLQNFDVYGDRKYRYTYKFDESGNWIVREVEKQVTVNGKTTWEPAYVNYRTITYY